MGKCVLKNEQKCISFTNNGLSILTVLIWIYKYEGSLLLENLTLKEHLKLRVALCRVQINLLYVKAFTGSTYMF